MKESLLISRVFLLLITVSAANAQDILSGQVVNKFKAPLAGCNIHLTDGRSGTTNETGYFELIDQVTDIAHTNTREPGISIKNNQIEIVINTPANIQISIYSLNGKRIYKAAYGPLYPGTHNRDVPSLEINAIYFLRVITGSVIRHFRMTRVSADDVLLTDDFTVSRDMPLARTGAEVTDTLLILCPDFPEKTIEISSYDTDLGVVAIDSAEFKEEIIAKLTGIMEIAENTTIDNRQDSASRAITRTYLREKLEEFGIQPQTQSLVWNSYLLAVNVFGIIPATTNSKKYILFGAHYDTQGGPGANDNASGVALVMETARKIALLETRNTNFIVAFFDKEEEGLVGSSAMAQMFIDSSYDITSVHTIDQVAWDDDGDRAIELELPTDRLFDFYHLVASNNNITTPINRTSVKSSDHDAFRKLGYDAVGITEEYAGGDTSPHTHRSEDTFDTVNFDYLDYVTSFFILVMKAYAEITGFLNS